MAKAHSRLRNSGQTPPRTGVDPLGNSYLASDPATVRVIDPAIRLEKSVSETLVLNQA